MRVCCARRVLYCGMVCGGVRCAAKIAQKKKALTEHETWLEQAKRALERVKKQMQETRLSAKAIKGALSKYDTATHTALRDCTHDGGNRHDSPR
jgi:hypothetical protein